MKNERICLVPRLSGVGGMVSFQNKLAAGLRARGIPVSYDLDNKPYGAVLVVGGTRQLGRLWRARRQGVPVVQRLDGMNWLHRLRWPGLHTYLRAEYGNCLLALIRSRLASQVIYQSQFARRWWEQVHGPVPVPSQVVYNAVDLAIYTPQGPQDRPVDRIRLLLVEGSLSGGYEAGLEHAVRLAEGLDESVSWERLEPGRFNRQRLELMVVGRVSSVLREHWQRETHIPLLWVGLAAAEKIPAIDRSAHLFFSGDLNPACPNAVIEALACGTPVIAFATGALPELVAGDAGRVVPYGGDPWRLETPDLGGLVAAAGELLDDLERCRAAARARAEAMFNLDHMVSAYLEALDVD
jgi:glycosyltransferase involved in cell wall biosynthesis